MSEYEIEYCPWCGGNVTTTIETKGHDGFQAKKCVDCETVFKVQVPHRKTKINWTTAR